jgi:type I restriction enzyme, S subunit
MRMRGSTLKKLGEVLEFKNGKSIKPGGIGEYPVYGSNGIIGGCEDYKEKNGIIIGRVGAYCGSVSLYRGKFWASDNTIVAYPKNMNYNLVFLSYLLGELNLNRWAGGAAQPLLTQTVLKQVDAPIPPILTQNKIAAILSAYDDLIENNLRRIKILEEMAQLIYREWFVHFRFPGHEKVKMIDSPLGKIPEGWEIVKLQNEIEVIRGLSYSGKYLSKNGLPMHNLNSICEGGGYKYAGIKYYSGPYKEKDTVIPGDIIVANTEQTWERLLIGYAAIIPHCFGQEGIYSHHLYRVRPLLSSYLTKPFIFLMLNDEGLRGWVSRFGNGTTINMLPRDALSLPQIVKPPRCLIECFTEKIIPALVLMENLTLKSKVLHSIRDLLLPKLISGELDVSDLDINLSEEVSA